MPTLANRMAWPSGGARSFAHRDVAAGAGLVVDQDRVAAALGQFRSQHAGDDVAAAARGEADDQPQLLSTERTAPGSRPATGRPPRSLRSTIVDGSTHFSRVIPAA
jgi:hypothetical protein